MGNDDDLARRADLAGDGGRSCDEVRQLHRRPRPGMSASKVCFTMSRLYAASRSETQSVASRAPSVPGRRIGLSVTKSTVSCLAEAVSNDGGRVAAGSGSGRLP